MQTCFLLEKQQNKSQKCTDNTRQKTEIQFVKIFDSDNFCNQIKKQKQLYNQR